MPPGLKAQILNNRGGLYGRVGLYLSLRPWTLWQCEDYCKRRGLALSRAEILKVYLRLGGIPRYWSLLRPDISFTEQLRLLCLEDSGALYGEGERLLAVHFASPHLALRLLSALAYAQEGLTRTELLRKTGVTTNGYVSAHLEKLGALGFVIRTLQEGKKIKDALYALSDPFLLFFLTVLREFPPLSVSEWRAYQKGRILRHFEEHAFHLVCRLHLKELRQVLGIAGILCEVRACELPSSAEDGESGRCDLLLLRADEVVEVLMTRYSGEYVTLTARRRRTLETLRAYGREISTLQERVPHARHSCESLSLSGMRTG